MNELPANLRANPILSRWITIDPVDSITIATGKVELGQGAVTAIAAMAAAELGVRLDQLRIRSGDTQTTPDEGYTAGSFSIEHGGGAMRGAAALVRGLFAAAAAARLGGIADDIMVEAGLFRRAGYNEALSYWQLREAVDLERSALEVPMPARLPLRTDDGSLKRLDLEAKFTGAAFIQDMVLPGMLHGRVLRGKHPKDRLVAFDRDAVAAMPGVASVVVDGTFTGVVARRSDQAIRAIAKAEASARFERSADLPTQGEANGWMAVTPVIATTTLVADAGAAPSAAIRHSAGYTRPYLAHASIGPSTAVAEWRGPHLTVWTHSQGVFPLRQQLALALRIEVDAIDVVHVSGAGCYGHNGADDVALDAALLARAAGAPVMCQWSRAEELTWSPFGAAMCMRLAAGLDRDGRIVAWTHDVTSPPHVARPMAGDGVNLLAAWSLAEPHGPAPPSEIPPPAGGGSRNAVPLYSLGHRRIRHHLLPQGPLRSSALRSLGAHGNVFAIESFMDELALLAGRDPVRFRLDHLDDPRAVAVIEAVARLAKWDAAEPGGEGRGRGLAFSRYKGAGAYCAVIVEIEVTERIELKRAFAAVDAGEIIHRDGLVNQIEGGLVQAASWTLKEEAGWNESGFKIRSFADYPILSFSETPAIEVAVLDRPDLPPLGAGECAAGPMAAAIGNALAHALGLRVRDLPLTPERIAKAINAL